MAARPEALSRDPSPGAATIFGAVTVDQEVGEFIVVVKFKFGSGGAFRAWRVELRDKTEGYLVIDSSWKKYNV